MIKTLAKERLANFVAELKKEHLVYLPLPQKKGGDFLFQKAVDVDLSHLKLEAPMTLLPPSVFLLPLREKVIEIVNSRYLAQSKIEPILLFGVSAADIRAINRLDVILRDIGQDLFYQQKRKNTIIIGLPDASQARTFQQALNPEQLRGFDLFLEMVNNQYLVTSGSEKGDDLLKMDFFEKEVEAVQEEFEEAQPSLDLKKIKWAVEKTKGGKVWQKWADICLGCGNCSFVCPLCFCYQLRDRVDLKGEIARVREQSTCFLADFDQIAGGFNPREDFVDRFYHWYHHKFVQMPEEFGFSGCVNCGRCIKYCPAEINFREVLTEAIEEAEHG